MIVLGIDPGTATTGYGFIEITSEYIAPIKFDLIETKKVNSPEKRLAHIYKELCFLINKYNPREIAMEKVFFATNRKTAIRVGQAQGVMLLAAATCDVPIFEYAPGTIKKLVAGDGRADKKAVEQAVREILGNSIHSKPNGRTHFDNAADALAVALCHFYVKRDGHKTKKR